MTVDDDSTLRKFFLKSSLHPYSGAEYQIVDPCRKAVGNFFLTALVFIAC